MQWVVYGAGAVGGVLGARLAEAGEDVVLVARGEHLKAIQHDGLLVRTPDDQVRVDVPAVASVGSVDLDRPTAVLLAVKSHQTAAVIEDLTTHAPPATRVVSVQNGVANEPTLLRFFTDVHGVCVMMPVAHLDPGVVEQESVPVPGILDVGRFPGGVDETTHAIATAFRAAGFVSEPRADVMAWKHRKLLMNLGNAAQACFAPGPPAQELTRRARSEGEVVLERAGIAVVSREQDRARRADILTSARGPKGVSGGSGGRAGGSSWQSLRRGTGTIESDYLNGEVVLLGRLHDVPTPVNELLRRTAARMAREGAAPGSLDAAGLLADLG